MVIFPLTSGDIFDTSIDFFELLSFHMQTTDQTPKVSPTAWIINHQTQSAVQVYIENPDNKLNKLVPPIITSNYNLRKTRKFRVPVANTKRFAESFIMKGAQLA